MAAISLVRSKVREPALTLFRAQNGFCAGCGHRLPPIGDLCLIVNCPSIDHLIARARGGGDHIGNMLLMHSRCNSAKGDRPPTGCERIWHHVVLAALEIHPLDIGWRNEPPRNPAMADALSSLLQKGQH